MEEDISLTTTTQEVEAQEIREVNFEGDLLLIAMVDGIPYVAIRPICDALVIDWTSQYRRIQDDEVLDEEKRLVIFKPTNDDQQRKMVALPLELMHGWLFGITVKRLKKPTPEIVEKIQQYRRRCFKVLWDHFNANAERQALPSPSTSIAILQSVRNQSLAVAQMAEEQIILQEKVKTISTEVDKSHNRLDKAAKVVGDLQSRLGTVEKKLSPAALVTDNQAEEISSTVKALSELMTIKDPSKNHYQGIFSELYRRFGVSSYKNVHIEDYEKVLNFLEDWRQAALKGKSEEGQ